MNRRDFLVTLAAALAGEEKLPPVRAITRGPAFHWFGYYDKLQFDPTNRFALGVEGTFEHRLPTPADKIKLGMVDLANNDRWIKLGESSAWSWHQTCMLQWLPGSKSEILWNDREGDRFVCHVLDVETRKRRTLPSPVYALRPDARWAIATDFRRLYDVRPETGYAGVSDPNRDILAPDDAGIWKVDLRSGRHELLISIAQAAKITPFPPGDWTGAKHWFNHLLYSPDGARFVFLHRFRTKEMGRAFSSRMFIANHDGKNLRLLDWNGKTSHFNWSGPNHLIVWRTQPSHGSRFYRFDANSGKTEAVAPDILTRDGHVSYLPGNRWILTDTSPDEQRKQHPYLFDTRTGRLAPLGHFYSPPEYTGFWRCDTTPRFSPDGRKVVVDSPHGGNGRQMYLIDISEIVGKG
jgi:hypothetical protein